MQLSLIENIHVQTQSKNLMDKYVMHRYLWRKVCECQCGAVVAARFRQDFFLSSVSLQHEQNTEVEIQLLDISRSFFEASCTCEILKAALLTSLADTQTSVWLLLLKLLAAVLLFVPSHGPIALNAVS